MFQLPFRADESIDYETLEGEIEWLISAGVDGVVFAMVSELLRLSDQERREVARVVCEQCRGRIATIVSVGSESTSGAVAHARHAEEVGASAVMAIPPVSTAALPEELKTYYHKLIEAIEIPVVVQDASGYVGQPMSVALQASLHQRFGQRVMFKPEAAPIGPRLTELREATRGKASIFEGTGGIALVDSFARGICGTMPGADIVDVIIYLWGALSDGDQGVVDTIGPLVSAYIAMQTSLDAFLAIEKHTLCRRGVFRNVVVRGPKSYRLDEQTRREADRLFDLMMAAMDPAARAGQGFADRKVAL